MSQDKDPSKSEGVLLHTVFNASKFSGTSFSEPVFIRSLQWRIMITLQVANHVPDCKFMGFFVHCCPDSDNPAWSCYAKAELVLVSTNPAIPHIRKKFSHIFHENENDWGYGNFKVWSEVLDPYNGYVIDDIITLEAHVEADLPHGVHWDSKKLTGYVGLRNQGATCYMNSLLQTLFFTNQFRKAVYQIPFRGIESVAFALQRVFYGLQFSDTSVDTKILTNSFGWKTSDTLRQQDVHEFLRLLLDKLEGMIENSAMKGTFSYLFEGEMVSTVECTYVNYRSSRTETFYDIQLNIVGKNNILDSLDSYVAPEILNGDNKYDAGEYGLQEAEKKVVFSKFPPVLYLHLLRFHYDPEKDCSVKCNSRVEFPEHLNLHEYMVSPKPVTELYSLHSVLVHSGNNRDGHYVVYINPELRGNWYIFDDDVVCRCSKREAIDGNFGGEPGQADTDEDSLRRHYRNAYVLVYIQQSLVDTILQNVTQKDIPTDLMTKLLNKIKLEESFRRDNKDFITVQLVLEDSFQSHEGKDLFDPKAIPFIPINIHIKALLGEFLEWLSVFFKFPKDQMRIWPLNEEYRPVFLKTENISVRLQVKNTPGFTNPWVLFLEILPPDSDQTVLPLFDQNKHALVFFKAQLPKTRRIIYCGHHYVVVSSPIAQLMNILNEKAGFPKSTVWKIYLELNGKNLNEVFDSTKYVLQNGDILVFQTLDDSKLIGDLAGDSFKELCLPIEITVCDEADPDNSRFTLNTHHTISYEDLVRDVSNKLGIEPSKLHLFYPEERSGFPHQGIIQNVTFPMNSFLLGGGDPKAVKMFYKSLLVPVLWSEDKIPSKKPREISKLEEGDKLENNGDTR